MIKKQDSLNDLEIDIQKKQKILEEYHDSFKILKMQVSGLRYELENHKNLVRQIYNSPSWKITSPVRIFVHLKNGKPANETLIEYFYRRLRKIYQREGYSGIYNRVNAVFPFVGHFFGRIKENIKINKPVEVKTEAVQQKDQGNSVVVQQAISQKYSLNHQFLKNNQINIDSFILIVAEVTLPQCYRYRVQQKKGYFEKLGWQCKVIDWRDQNEVLSALQVCKDVIFYRVPGFPNVMEQIAEAKRLGLSPWWEVDDLIFDEQLYLQCSFMEMLPKEEKDLLLFGSGLFRQAMLACDRGIASTTSLAYFMRQAGLHDVIVIENALDQETLRIASNLYPVRKETHILLKKKEETVILYGSGTNTHGADFLIAADGIVAALEQEPSLRLWIVGELELPEQFKKVQKQIRYIASQSYELYMELLAQADITIAPLEPIGFNDAKSNIKFLEAAVLGIPAVCSPRQAFKDILKDSKNGFFANSASEWEEKLLTLARDSALRQKMGKQAYRDVLKRYSPENICETQVKPVFKAFEHRVENKLKVLMVNIYYDPYSYGGATQVTEQMARKIHGKDEIEVTIFTSDPAGNGSQGLRRYESHGKLVYAATIPEMFNISQQFNNIDMIEPFEMVLDAVKPDIVHFHAIQNFGLHLLYACQRKHIPYVITLHDSWWLCDRQFMVKANNQYCFQKKINLDVCRYCQPGAKHLEARMAMMIQGLSNADMLLSPSETHRQLYLQNDLNEKLVKVNRNGVSRPLKARTQRQANMPLRFGFVAGDEVIKGYELIRDAFMALNRSDWHLSIIDSKVNMGYTPIDVQSWRVKGKVVTIPPYDEASKDDFFDNIDVLLFPSQWKESYGLTVREALLRDVWVISTAPGGQSEDIEEGVNGTCISLSGNYKELQKAIEDLLDRTSFFDTYVNPHKQHIMSWGQQAEELIGHYRMIHQNQKSRKHPVS